MPQPSSPLRSPENRSSGESTHLREPHFTNPGRPHHPKSSTTSGTTGKNLEVRDCFPMPQDITTGAWTTTGLFLRNSNYRTGQNTNKQTSGFQPDNHNKHVHTQPQPLIPTTLSGLPGIADHFADASNMVTASASLSSF